MRIVKIEKNINSAGEHRVTFEVSVEGVAYEMMGFASKDGLQFSFGKNETSYFEGWVGSLVSKIVSAKLKQERIGQLEHELKTLKGI